MEVPAATETLPEKVLEVVLVPAEPNVVTVPPLLLYCTVNVAPPELTAVFHTTELRMKVCVASAVSVTL
jgi:hypothetical protein